MTRGKLILVPTPIGDYQLHQNSFERLLVEIEKGSLFLVEEHKVARRRWLKWGLPRECIENFRHYNEHNQKIRLPELIEKMQKGRNLCLLSDCGLPAFCDPGRELVKLAHQHQITVTSLPFDNSVVLALALSGFPHDSFSFEGFLPREKASRRQCFQKMMTLQQTVIFMDTPYRLSRVLDELNEHVGGKRQKLFCFACELLGKGEEVLVGDIAFIKKKLSGQKREFIGLMTPLEN